MALEAVVFPQNLLGSTVKGLYNMVGEAAWCSACGGDQVEQKAGDVAPSECEIGGGGTRPEVVLYGSTMAQGISLVSSSWGASSSSLPETAAKKVDGAVDVAGREASAGGRKRRRRTRVFKNQEQVENQRMTHIAVERNRRKQMNEYLAVLQSLMPASYVPRGDQASVIGGAINFVKVLEQLLQSLEARKRIEQRMDAAPFADFFSFPQYSTGSSCCSATNNAAAGDNAHELGSSSSREKRPALADIEVTMTESHANLKVLSRRRPKQLLRMVLGLQDLRLTTLHLNVTCSADMAFYSFSLKVEDDCQLTSVDDIATAVHQMVGKIQE